MALQLSSKNQTRIAELIEDGTYPDADAVVERALDLLNEVERLNHLRSLLAASAEQAARGEVIPYDDALRRRLGRAPGDVLLLVR